MDRYLPILYCVLMIAHTTVKAETSTEIQLDKGELSYVGRIDENANTRLFALYESLNEKPTTLSIHSGGGDIVPGMALGEWVHARRLTVRVKEYCVSSCANYVFTAGARRIVGNKALIGFHGGASSTKFRIGGPMRSTYEAMNRAQKAAFLAELKLSTQPQQERETAFFHAIGVRQQITTHGQQDRFERIVRGWWTFTQEGFSAFGVNNIEVINPPWRPKLRALQSKVTTFGTDQPDAPAWRQWPFDS